MTRAIRWAMARELVTAVLAFIGLLFALKLCTGCSGPPPKEPDIIETTTAVKIHVEYKALLAECLKKGKEAKSPELAIACADAVDMSFCQQHKLRCPDGGAL